MLIYTYLLVYLWIYLWKDTRKWYLGCLWGGELDSCGTGWEGNLLPCFCTFCVLYHVSVILKKITIFKQISLPSNPETEGKKLVHMELLLPLAETKAVIHGVTIMITSCTELFLCAGLCGRYTCLLQALPQPSRFSSFSKRGESLAQRGKMTCSKEPS